MNWNFRGLVPQYAGILRCIVSMLARHYWRRPTGSATKSCAVTCCTCGRDRHNGPSTLIVAVSALRVLSTTMCCTGRPRRSRRRSRMKRPKIAAARVQSGTDRPAAAGRGAVAQTSHDADDGLCERRARERAVRAAAGRHPERSRADPGWNRAREPRTVTRCSHPG